VVVEDGAGVVSPPAADHLPVVLEDRDELDVAGPEGGRVLRQLGEWRRVGSLVQQQEQRFVCSSSLLDALPHSHQEGVDEPDEDGAQLVLDVLGPDDVEGVGGVEEPIEVDARLPAVDWTPARVENTLSATRAVVQNDSMVSAAVPTVAPRRVRAAIWASWLWAPSRVASANPNATV